MVLMSSAIRQPETMFTDTHCHLTAVELQQRQPEILAQAAAVGVSGLVVPSAQADDWPAVVQLLAHPSVRAAAVGLHPWFAGQATPAVWSSLDTLLRQHPALWVGETGLDFLHAADQTARTTQLDALNTQLDLAQQHRRPVILHQVKAAAALLGSLKHTGFNQGGIVHAFSGSIEEAQQFIRHGLLIGLGSLLLNPNAKKARQAAALLPATAIVLETDSPYMLSGRSNTPANTAQIAAIVARLRGITPKELAQSCEKNLSRLLPETLPNPKPQD